MDTEYIVTFEQIVLFGTALFTIGFVACCAIVILRDKDEKEIGISDHKKEIISDMLVEAEEVLVEIDEIERAIS